MALSIVRSNPLSEAEISGIIWGRVNKFRDVHPLLRVGLILQGVSCRARNTQARDGTNGTPCRLMRSYSIFLPQFVGSCRLFVQLLRSYHACICVHTSSVPVNALMTLLLCRAFRIPLVVWVPGIVLELIACSSVSPKLRIVEI